MGRTNADFERLTAELESDAGDLVRVIGKNERARSRIELGASDLLDWAALGYTIHNA